MNIKRTNRNSKKGITIVEVVISLVLIGLITASTVSVMIMSINVENNSAAAVEIKNSAENVVECFRFANTQEEFDAALSKCGDYNKTPEGSFVLISTNHTVTLKADFTENKLEYSAVNFDGDEIYSFVYPSRIEDDNEGSDAETGSDSETEGEGSP